MPRCIGFLRFFGGIGSKCAEYLGDLAEGMDLGTNPLLVKVDRGEVGFRRGNKLIDIKGVNLTIRASCRDQTCSGKEQGTEAIPVTLLSRGTGEDSGTVLKQERPVSVRLC